MTDSERLILEVEKKPCLWQTASEEYSRREIKDKAWEEVCRELYPQCEDYFEIQKQVADLKKKWVNIRAYYRKEMLTRKEEKNGQQNAKRKKYVFADILQFLDPVLDNKEPEENTDNCSDENNTNIGEEEDNNLAFLHREKVRKTNLQGGIKQFKPIKNTNGIMKVRKNSKKSSISSSDIILFDTPSSYTSNLIPNNNNNNNININHNNSTNYIKPDDEETAEDLRKINTNTNLNLNSNSNLNANISTTLTSTSTPINDIKPIKIETINPVEIEILNILKNIQQSPQNNKEIDPDTSFLLSLVPDMKSLTDMQKIQFKTGIFLLLNQLKFSNSNLNIHSPSPIPFTATKTQFNFPFYNPWAHYIQETQNNSSLNSIPPPSSLNVSPPLPSSSTTTPSVSNPTPLFPRDSTVSAFSPAPCTPMSKNYH